MDFRMLLRADAAALMLGMSLLPIMANAQTDTVSTWDDVTAAALLNDATWHAFLTAQLSGDVIRHWKDYPAAQEARFTEQDGWHIATFCAPAGCDSEEIVMAFAPATDNVLLGLRDAERVTFVGTPREPLPAPVVTLYQDSVSSAALRAGFMALPDHKRRDLQEEMYFAEVYASDLPDGLYGPMTEAGLIAFAPMFAARLGEMPNFSQQDTAETALRNIATSTFMPHDAPAGSFTFEGQWSCDGGALTLTSRSHEIGGSPRSLITEVLSFDHGAGTDYSLLLREIGRVVLRDVTQDSLTWQSLASGDMLDCRKTGDAPAPPTVTERPPLPALPVAAPAEAIAPAPVDPGGDAAAADLPFLGRWSCAGMEFSFAADSGTNHAEDNTQAYHSVTQAEPNVWDVTFADGVAVRLGVMNEGRMMMIVFDQAMSCERVTGR